MFGLQARDDDINIGLDNTFRRQFLSNTLFDHVNEGNVGVYAENTTRWTDWWRTTLGLRGDYFAASVNSVLQPANSGNPNAALPSPKFTTVFGPFHKTEFFLGAGLGYHSNDARGVMATEVPGDPTTPQSGTAFLVRSAGAEIGARTKIVPGLNSSISLFYLHQNSELFFDGDTGTTVPGPPSDRTGIEITNNYQPVSWMRFDADLALTRARFVGTDTAQQELFEITRGFSASADRQRARQLYPRSAMDGCRSRHYAWREDRLVQHIALALYQFAAAHRGRRISVAAA